MNRRLIVLALSCLAVSTAYAARRATNKSSESPDAKAFVARANEELSRLTVKWATAEWLRGTHFSDDTDRSAALASQDLQAWRSRTARAAAHLDASDSDDSTRHALHRLQYATTLPAPSDPRKRQELATALARIERVYAESLADGKSLQMLEETLAKSRNRDELLKAWRAWHDVASPMRSLFAQSVSLANEGAQDLNAADVGELWRSAYDVPPAQVEADAERLWQQVKPLYDDLHCYVRSQLQKSDARGLPADGTLPAHLLGNMWGQSWENLYPLIEPFPNEPSPNIARALQRDSNPAKMARTAESFFTGLGFDPLPTTFWSRSMLTKPKDRSVICQASAFEVGEHDDPRLRMCVRMTQEDFVTLHHELAHVFYSQAYSTQPAVFRAGANDAFHEAIGNAIELSMTPTYFKNAGLLDSPIRGEHAVINEQLRLALETVAFLPFARVAEQWRWDVYAGRTRPENYNAAWWALVRRYQGISPPEERFETAFDAGAKYHVATHIPLLRAYFADILQFQLHQALCEATGLTRPLHDCSIAGSPAAGVKLKAMMSLGASRPWPAALEAISGQRQIDGAAMLAYFKPLHDWLKVKNQGAKCGW